MVKQGLFIGWSFLCGGFLNAQVLETSIDRWPDTGQNQSYTATVGEDSDYTIAPMQFDGSIIGLVQDMQTGLMWQQADGGEMTYENALLYADTCSLGGYTDWRLPSPIEALSILNHQNNNPALSTGVWSSSTAEYWWTSQRQVNDVNKIWVTNAGGGIGNHPKSETLSAGGNKRFHAKLVRGGNSQVFQERFIVENDGSVRDQLTDLVWIPVASSDSMVWEDALSTAENTSFGNSSDWRLPNVKELLSLNDYLRHHPSLNDTVFSAAGHTKFWSSTTLANSSTKAWYWDTAFGISTYALKTSRKALFLVRGPDTLITGLNQEPQRNIVYPNPSSGAIILPNAWSGKSIQIIDERGDEFEIKSIDTSLNLQFLPSGMYFIRPTNSSIKPLRIYLR